MEIHLRDVLAKARADISDGERLTFEGLTKWLADENCYLRKVGVNCVELQPVQEFTAAKRPTTNGATCPSTGSSPQARTQPTPKIRRKMKISRGS